MECTPGRSYKQPRCHDIGICGMLLAPQHAFAGNEVDKYFGKVVEIKAAPVFLICMGMRLFYQLVN